MTITHRVEYADLDLTVYSDVKELERRISDKAKVGCEQLAVLYPIAKESIATCVQGSVSGAMEQAQKVIDAANAKR